MRPDKIVINGLTYKILWQDYAWWRSVNATAQFDPVKQTISVYADLHPEQVPMAFVHEVTHALLWYRELNADGIKSEDCCNVAGYDIVGVWRANPDVFAWWISQVTRRHDEKESQEDADEG